MGAADITLKRRAFSDPTRVRIRETLGSGPKTVRQLGDELGVNPNRLYYHLRILEEAELIEVTGTVAEGRMVEKVYGAAGGSFGNELPGDDPAERITFFHSLLDATKADLTDVILEQARQAGSGQRPLLARLIKGVAIANAADIEELVTKVDQLIQHYSDRAAAQEHNGDEVTAYPFTIAIYERPTRRQTPPGA